jgi:hypothetical protein
LLFIHSLPQKYAENRFVQETAHCIDSARKGGDREQEHPVFPSEPSASAWIIPIA